MLKWHQVFANWLKLKGKFNTENVITCAWSKGVPPNFHEPLARGYGVTSQTVILNYPLWGPENLKACMCWKVLNCGI